MVLCYVAIRCEVDLVKVNVCDRRARRCRVRMKLTPYHKGETFLPGTCRRGTTQANSSQYSRRVLSLLVIVSMFTLRCRPAWRTRYRLVGPGFALIFSAFSYLEVSRLKQKCHEQPTSQELETSADDLIIRGNSILAHHIPRTFMRVTAPVASPLFLPLTVTNRTDVRTLWARRGGRSRV